MSTRAWRACLLVGVALCGGYFLLPKGAASQNLLYDALNFASAGAVAAAVWIYRPERARPWYFLAAGQALSGLGNLSYDYYDLVRHVAPPFPGISDVFYLGAYPLLAAGLLLIIQGRNRQGDRTGLVDATIIATGLGMLSWVFLMLPYARDPSLSLAERTVSIAYPLMDVLLLFMVARLLVSPGVRATGAYWCLTLSFAAMLIADAVYAWLILAGTYTDGSPVDAGWILWFVLFGLAALNPSMRELANPPAHRVTRLSKGRIALLAGASLMAPGALAVQSARGQIEGAPVIAVGSAVLFLLVLLRMAGLVREVQAKVGQLRAQGERLEEAEARYRGVVEHIPAVTFVEEIDPTHPGEERSLYVSPQVQSLLGYSPAEWRGRQLRSSIVHGHDHDRVLAAREQSRSRSEPIREEYRLLTKGGESLWVREETMPVLQQLQSDDLQEWQGILFDVSGHRLAEDALRGALSREREAAGRLRSLDEMKNTFLHAVSHELRTPLAVILGFALTLERKDLTLSPADQNELIHRLAANARKLDRLLGDLLDLDRLDRGILEPNRRVVDLGGLIRRLVAESTVLGSRDVHVEIPPDLVGDLDAAMVERIVENLLANAARHTSATTPIWVRAEGSSAGMLISVEDAGPGVPESLRGSIFEPFQQGAHDGAHSPGVGIGLSLVDRFARLHGGKAWVEDRPGGGAAFRVLLPTGLGREEAEKPLVSRGVT